MQQLPLAPRVQTRAEEIANTVSHGIGALLSAVGLAMLVAVSASGGDPWRITSVSVFGASLVLLFLASALYHAMQDPRVKRVFQALDHAAIFLLIAGTYTPFALVVLGGAWGWSLFGAVWGIAAFGIPFEVVLLERFPKISTILYLAAGWVGIFAVVPLYQALPFGALCWIVGGGIAYTLGVIFFAWERLPYHHTIWHLFVLLGAGCHFFAVLRHVVPLP